MGLVRTFEGSWEAREAAALGDDTGKVGARVWRVRRQRNNESRLGLGRKSLGAGGGNRPGGTLGLWGPAN